MSDHVFWADEIGYDLAMLSGVIGHRQVTDAYLVALAARNGGMLATFDKPLAILHPKAAELIAT